MWHPKGKEEVHTQFWCRNLRERDHLEGVGIDWRAISNRSSRKDGCIDWNEQALDRDYVGCGEFPDSLKNCQPLKKDFAPWRTHTCLVADITKMTASGNHSKLC